MQNVMDVVLYSVQKIPYLTPWQSPSDLALGCSKAPVV